MTRSDYPPLRSAVIIPARGQGALLNGALASLKKQVQPPDEIIVVDDSPNGLLQPIDGVTLLRGHGGGPYRARNLGWRATDADILLFMDTRSRPSPTWSRDLVGAFTDSVIGIAGSDTKVLDGPTWAARTAAHQQIFALERYVAGPWELPYFPTCNLAVRRDALQTVGGFADRRSGADADLCWRIQKEAGAAAVGLPETLMDWIPRDRLLEYVEQFFRYGRSGNQLQREWSPAMSLAAPASWPRLGARSARLLLRLARDLRHRDDDAVVRQLAAATGIAHGIGARASHDSARLKRLRQRLRVTKR